MLKTEEFIEKSKVVHGEKYNYSKTIYENNLKEVIIICKEHGEFLQLPKTHKRGSGCNECANSGRKINNKSNTSEFIQKAIKIHGYRYEYLKVEYISAIKPVIIICKYHGEFMQTPNGHLSSSGCKKCSDKLKCEKKQKPF
jgi:hypothetical protein